MTICCVCGHELFGSEERGICPSCKSRPRVRSIATLIERYILPYFGKTLKKDGSALCFAMTRGERLLMSRFFDVFESVSLYGIYGKEHTIGVDVRDLSRYADSTFSAHYSCLLFDYIVEHERAIKEAYRVIAPGGLFITHIEGPRVLDGFSAPKAVQTIKPRAGYYEYIPDGEQMLSVTVGREWFISAMHEAGFHGYVARITDPSSGVICDWFLGHKVRASSVASIKVENKMKEAEGAVEGGEFLSLEIPAESPNACEVLLQKEEMGHAALSGADSRKLLKEYSIPMPAGLPFRQVTVALSVPNIPGTEKGGRFAEHVPATNGDGNGQVIVCSLGGYFLSNDLGESWDKVRVKGYENVPFVNAFSLPDGRLCLQAKGMSPKLSFEDQPYAGLTVTCDKYGEVIAAATLNRNQWHGSSSVDFSEGVALFADYALNLPRVPDHKAGRYPNGVFRSVDGGSSWVKVFERAGDGIRHFHTVRADPFQPRTWYLSSGDLPEEVNLWVSRDAGVTWQEAIRDVPVSVRPRFRLTDMVFTEEGLLWGSDDILGDARKMGDHLPVTERTGARMFFADRDNLGQPREIGYVGQPVRSVVDLGLCWFIITQGTMYGNCTRPRVFLLTKAAPFRLIHLFDVDNYSGKATGFTYSCHSRVAEKGIFFTVKGRHDVLINPLNLLKWSVTFE